MTGSEMMAATDQFVRLADSFRPELLAHCYRMTGSVHDAEDVVQETYLRAWRSYDRFEGRSSLRTWLYRIATNTCLTALDRNSRRPLPSGLAGPSDDSPRVEPARTDVPWLQPLPDSLVSSDPADLVVSRASVRLAFVAALQYLQPRQRAVLILRDVLAWPAAQVAELLDTSTVAVNSALQRARAQLAEVMPTEDATVEPTDAEQRELLERYVEALESADLDAFVHLLRKDVELEMPPVPTWFAGRHAVGVFFASRIFEDATAWRFIPSAANGQPAVAMYHRADDGTFRPHTVMVLTVAGGRVAHIVAFRDTDLFAGFALPPTA